MMSFKEMFYKSLVEDMTSAGCLGSNAANVKDLQNSDWFAPGDARIPMGSKMYTRRGLLKKKRKYKK